MIDDSPQKKILKKSIGMLPTLFLYTVEKRRQKLILSEYLGYISILFEKIKNK